jgi:hypothetical protein
MDMLLHTTTIHCIAIEDIAVRRDSTVIHRPTGTGLTAKHLIRAWRLLPTGNTHLPAKQLLPEVN